MSRLFLPAALSLATLSLAGAGAATARPIDADWPEVARASDGDCVLTVTANGRFLRISASGLGPGETARYGLANGTMRPIVWRVRADGNGEFARYYLPWRENHGDAQVTITLASARCTLSADFPFRAYTG